MNVTTEKNFFRDDKVTSMIWIERSLFLLLIIISVVIVFMGLGKGSLLDYDEGIYSEVAREMVESNNWLTMTYGRELWFEKPPAYIWATALLFKFFDVNEFWARAVSGFSSVMVVLLTYKIGSFVFGRRVGILSIIPLITSYEFLRQSRNGTTDIFFTLFLMMALAAYIMSAHRKKVTWYLLAIAFSLGFMVKFWAAIIVIIAIGINTVSNREVRDTISSKHFWGAVLVALGVILPWHLIMYVQHGQAFIDRYIVYDLLTRSMSPLEGNTGTSRYYFDRMAYDYSPWFFLLPIAFTIEFKRVLNHRDKSRALLIFTACIFGIYSIIVSTKIFHYLTPIYPILAIFIANVIVKAYNDHHTTAFSGLVITALVAMIVPSKKVLVIYLILVGLMYLILFFARSASSRRNFYSEAVKQKEFRGRELITGKMYGFLSSVGQFFEKKYFPKLLVIQIFIFLVLLGVLGLRPLYKAIETPVEQIAKVAGTSPIIREQTIIALALPPNYDKAILGPAARFYSNRPIEVAWTEEELSLFTSQGSREIIMEESFINLLEDEYEFIVLARRSPFIYAIINNLAVQ